MSRARMRSWRIVAVVAAAALVLTACGSDKKTTSGGQGASATIGFVGALTGDNANLGVNIRDGIRVAIDEENAKGGTQINLKEFDTAGDPAQASTIKDRFIGDPSVIGIVGPAFSGETKALIPSLQDAGLVMISPSATNVALPDVVPNATVFHRVIGDDGLQGLGVARYLAEVEKPRSLALVHDNSEYGKGLTLGLEKEAKARGISTLPVETVDPKAQDFSATVNKIKAANPSHVFYGGYYAEAGRFKKQLSDAGVNAVFLSGDGSLDPGFITAAGASGEGSRIACPCNLALPSSTGQLKTFYDNYKQKIGKEPGLYSPEGFDAAKILIQGIKAGNRDRVSLLRFVEGVPKFEGVSKTIEFEPNGNLVRREFFVFQVKDGKIAPLQTVKVEG